MVWPIIDIFLRFLPTYLRYYRHSRWFNRDEIREMAYLRSWYPLGRNKPDSDREVVVFDHGPIFFLGKLQEFGPEITRSDPFKRWWAELFSRWAKNLDMLVLLDAPDSVLLERIYARTKWRRVMGQSEPEQLRFLGRYRRYFESTADNMARDYQITVCRLDSERYSSNELADSVYATATALMSQGDHHNKPASAAGHD